MNYVIIGSGVAGIAAIEAIRSVDQVGRIVMIGDDPHGFYSRPGLAYYLTGELHDKALFPRTADDLRRLNFHSVRGRVTRILRDEHALEIDGGQPPFHYDRLLIAVGAQALPLEVPGANLEGVVKLDHMEDAKRILKFARRGKTAVVVGGGITALELVEGLVARGMKVHYLLRGDRYWSNVLDATGIKDCGASFAGRRGEPSSSCRSHRSDRQEWQSQRSPLVERTNAEMRSGRLRNWHPSAPRAGETGRAGHRSWHPGQ